MFANTVKSDGFSVDFVFNKRTTKDATLIANIDLELEDFGLEEVKQACQPMFLDPGRKSVFTAAIGLDTTNHQIRRCSTAEYYHRTGSTKYIKKLERLKAQKGIKTIETNMPSPKTSQCAAYLLYIEYVLTHVGVLFTFYDYKIAKGRFYLYQGRQRAAEEMEEKKKQEEAKTDGKSKRKRESNYQKQKPKVEARKVPNGKRESAPCSLWCGNVWQRLDKAEEKQVWRQWCFSASAKKETAGDLIAVTIDEYKTSKVCNACNNDSLTSMPGLKGCSVQVCSICKALWQRDINACKNMVSISLSIWDGRGRPFQHSRN
ncbi:uncharacterized protein RHIMIDRAFT_292050 [Rhizopus microsporus ATCC 52813]|uniref:Uncharacterized protein n=1 Tax=Rhizopus microsporus ATCC 52813 TaxID=1340429 RepID=A0A2G4SVE0_RHIZD|nr:uncharacterized protein RHIMIDRAFT_292050 [Rhizopus microsporus ATCC 52813]PHZ12739.1 hypothetical protein RHIMIDRAFT_292050 [Rhizopus microsporus ATCC 52813]